MTELLRIEKLSVRFDGLVAVDGVDLTIQSGEIRGLIGPNGAGKTTLFNAISGLANSTSGKIVFAEEDITALPAHARAARGIRRTFQTVQLVQSFTVYENLLVGLHSKISSSIGLPIFSGSLQRLSERDASLRIGEVLRYLEIETLSEREVRSLTIAQQRLVEIAQALVAAPKLIMLDEPTAGLTPSQIEKLDALLVKLRDDWDVAILLVEHVVPLVLNVCGRITVLDRGKVIAEGPGNEIVESPVVRAAYLGEAVDA